jgi:hypothetical protein
MTGKRSPVRSGCPSKIAAARTLVSAGDVPFGYVDDDLDAETILEFDDGAFNNAPQP